MSIKPVKIPGVGMRNVKTALAAAFEPILGALLSENEYANRTP